jgi:hypothetical protein
MALTLNNTVSSAGANSYCSRASCLPILEQNIHIYATFAALTTANAESCLIYATTLLDAQVQWDGTKETDAQALRWPRTGVADVDGYTVDDDTHPVWLQEATSFYAYFLSQSDRTADSDTFGFKELKAGSLEMVIDKYDRIPTIPNIVWEIVKPYGTKMVPTPRVLERR